MTKKQFVKAAQAYNAREQVKRAAERIARKTVAKYPYSHNPYVPHEPVEDCFPGCVRVQS